MDWVSRYIEIPFKECGRDRTGCDCWGLVCLVFAGEKAIFLPEFNGKYETTKDLKAIQTLHDFERPKWVKVDIPKEFDLISLRIQGRPWHVGVVTQRGWMLHAARGAQTVHERYTEPLWKNRIEGFYRWAN